jgi:uncharacterized protein
LEGDVNSDLAALLVVQQHDDVIRAIEARGADLAPRLVALDKARQRALDEVARNAGALEKEMVRHRDLTARTAEHRERHSKNLAVLDQAHKVKEATAAMSQVETAARVLADDETELLTLTRRIADLRTATTAAREALADVEGSQAAGRQEVETDRAAIDRELTVARSRRAAVALTVGPSLLSKYERVQIRRKSTALFALNGFSCGSCDTAISLQRRPAMTSGQQAIEVCEGCGVLLYLPRPEE